MRIFFLVHLLIAIAVTQLTAKTDNRIKIDDEIYLIHLGDSVFIHETWENSDEFGKFPSNGLIIIKNGEAILVDTPFDNVKTERLLDYLKDSFGVKVQKLIACHSHDDCLGGLEFVHKQGIESIANSLTIEKCMENSMVIPSTAFKEIYSFEINDIRIVCRYFGAGHTIDNIIVWIPDYKILFGGCLIKSLGSKNLGNLKDAVVNDWDATVLKIIDEYRNVKYVIPGHGSYGGEDLLLHTVDLVNKYKLKQ